MEINDDNFEEIIQKENKLLIKLGAGWCKPCGNQDTIIQSMEIPFPVYHVDVDHNPKIAEKLLCRGVPFLVLYKDQEKVSQKIGLQSKEKLEEWFDEVA